MAKSHLFFQPYVGKFYDVGFCCNGHTSLSYRTMILGAYHVCSELFPCSQKSRCCSAKNIKPIDYSCPYNQQLSDKTYYNLHNASTIEIESYLDIASSNYPAYNDFTRKMLNRKPGFISLQERRELWDYVVFNNFLQHYLPCTETPPYDDSWLSDYILRNNYGRSRSMYDAAIPAFVEMLNTYKPLYIYVWTTSVRDCLIKNNTKLPGLNYEGELDFDLSSMSVYLFSYNRKEEPLPFDTINDTTLPIRHVILPENITIEETTSEALLKTPVGSVLHNYFIAKGRQLSFAELSKMKVAFESFLKGHGIITLAKGANHFESNKDYRTRYERRLMYTCLKNYLAISWEDLLSLIQGEPTIRTDSPSSKDKNLDIEALEKGFYEMMGVQRPTGKSLLYRLKN